MCPHNNRLYFMTGPLYLLLYTLSCISAIYLHVNAQVNLLTLTYQGYIPPTVIMVCEMAFVNTQHNCTLYVVLTNTH